MKLSVLDQAPITSGNTAVGALEKAEELAIVADELGYTRMWMAEHHGTRAFASSRSDCCTISCKNESNSNWDRRRHDDALFTIKNGRSI